MTIYQQLGKTAIATLACLTLVFQAGLGLAVDTDIYQSNVKQNAYVLMDNSTSMDFGVYESDIDYGAMYDQLLGAIDSDSGIEDTVMIKEFEDNKEYYLEEYPGYTEEELAIAFARAFYDNHEERKKIYLNKGNVGVSVTTVEDVTRAYTGDAADPNYLWYGDEMIDLHTYIDANGNLTGEAGYTQRLTIDPNGHVLLDGELLPLGQDCKLHDMISLYDGSLIDEGFGGQLNAPGYYFSGLKKVDGELINPDVGEDGGFLIDHVVAEDGDVDIYFFMTGNWMNMQAMYNLHYIADNTKPAWKYETFDEDPDGTIVSTTIRFPESGNYANDLSEADATRTLVHPGAVMIQVHFSVFDVEASGNVNNYNKDYVVLRDAAGTEIVKYDNDDNPVGSWSPVISGDTVNIYLESNSNIVGSGYEIDQYRVWYGPYLMQNRLDVSKEAMVAVIDEFRGKINWGYATYQYLGENAEGATINSALNPNDTDDANRAAIVNHVENTQPTHAGSPLGEALQDVFEEGYYGHRNSLDNLTCRRNYAIVVSDGFASEDDDWGRISNSEFATFSDFDGDGYTADPYQYLSEPTPENYYDDVAHWLYTHSWRDKSVVDPDNTYENVISHQIAFGTYQPLMEDAADEAGGVYITAYNKAQLVNAFYSVALMISEAISFTAPVVSVDAANKVQNGDDLYMGQFLPMDATYWPGNLKKFVLGDGSVERPDRWMIYDADNIEAIDSSGRFRDNTATFWGDDDDANDIDDFKAPDIKEDGVGEVLTERVAGENGDFYNGNYYARNIKTYLSSTLTNFTQSIDPTVFGLDASDTATRDKIVNWVYGYTFDADPTDGDPIAPRDWALGAIVHSRPTVVDYYNASDFSVIDKRYVIAGADDGMLHVFDDSPAAAIPGAEVLAFVPSDVLIKLKDFETLLHQPLVDGTIKLYRENGAPKYLIFGLRRGGASFWALDVSNQDPANWTVAWSFSDSEMVQSWSDVEIANIRTSDNAFTSVAIFSGGYDPYEDSFPEPFNDEDDNGTPFASNGNIDAQEWDKNDSAQDVNGNDDYDRMNLDGDSHGRAIYVVNVSTGELIFSVKNGATDSPAKGVASEKMTQTRTDFNYCFPASPSVVALSELYFYSDGGNTVTARKSNVLAAIYASDIYGNLFRITYNYHSVSPTWQVKHLFSANPDSDSLSGELRQGDSLSYQGRKVFYGPAVSWRGAGRFFDPSNYYYTGTTFSGTGSISSLYFGTGDREHPSYQVVQNRVYAIYDDLPVSTDTEVAVNSAPYTEDDLLNLTCDELGDDTTRVSGDTYVYKTGLETLLTDDVLNVTISNAMELNSSGGLGENDAKGWYIILENQGLSTYCSDCDYEATIYSSEGGRDYHVGEKVLSKLALFAGNLYFTSYQPASDDPCNPQGNAFSYALNYLDGSAALNLNAANDAVSGDDPFKKDVSDRYGKHTGVKGLPSGFEIVIRDGEAGAMSSIGGSIVGGGEDGYQIPSKDSGIDLYYWIER